MKIHRQDLCAKVCPPSFNISNRKSGIIILLEPIRRLSIEENSNNSSTVDRNVPTVH